jgi:glycosyltransferase involved in cell wall biosynthesis
VKLVKRIPSNKFESMPLRISPATAPIALIICTRDRAARLERCLERLPQEEIQELNAEVVVVDNGSEDETPVVLERFRRVASFPLRVIKEIRAGLGHARNAGLNHCSASLIAFTDDDCYLGTRYLPTAVSEFSSNEFQYCGGRILRYDVSDSMIGCNSDTRRQLVPPGSFMTSGKIQGANMVVHRRVFSRIGGFDPEFGAGARFRCEDIDLVARASMAGFTGAHIPGLVVYHHHGRKAGPETRRLARENDYACGAYYAKFIMNGHRNFILGWLKLAIRPWRLLGLCWEVRGALDYIRWRRSKRLIEHSLAGHG